MGGKIWNEIIGHNTAFYEENCGKMEYLDLDENKCRGKSYDDLVRIVGQQNEWSTASVGN